MNAKRKILVVEDKQHERLAIARLLWQEDYEVEMAESPEQAIGLIDQPFDLVISDLRMGENSGIDLLRLWKKCLPIYLPTNLTIKTISFLLPAPAW